MAAAVDELTSRDAQGEQGDWLLKRPTSFIGAPLWQTRSPIGQGCG
jgi:hypothetical protein